MDSEQREREWQQGDPFGSTGLLGGVCLFGLRRLARAGEALRGEGESFFLARLTATNRYLARCETDARAATRYSVGPGGGVSLKSPIIG